MQSKRDFPSLTQDNIREARLFATREDMIRSLPIARSGVIAEVGVALGDFSEFLISTLEPEKFFAIDTFEMHLASSHWGVPTSRMFSGMTHQAFYEKRLNGDNVIVDPRLSYVALADQQDNSFDMIYIDAEHTMDEVARDAKIAATKCKSNGVLIFNDYIMWDHMLGAEYGIVQAVNTLVVEHGWSVIGFALQRDMFCDIAIQR